MCQFERNIFDELFVEEWFLLTIKSKIGGKRLIRRVICKIVSTIMRINPMTAKAITAFRVLYALTFTFEYPPRLSASLVAFTSTTPAAIMIQITAIYRIQRKPMARIEDRLYLQKWWCSVFHVMSWWNEHQLHSEFFVRFQCHWDHLAAMHHNLASQLEVNHDHHLMHIDFL